MDYVIVINTFLNPEGHQNLTNVSKVTGILLKGWILPVGGASAVKSLQSMPSFTVHSTIFSNFVVFHHNRAVTTFSLSTQSLVKLLVSLEMMSNETNNLHKIIIKKLPSSLLGFPGSLLCVPVILAGIRDISIWTLTDVWGWKTGSTWDIKVNLPTLLMLI